jgi:hypothetical protein
LEGQEVVDDFEFYGLKIKCQTIESIMECKQVIVENRDLSYNEKYYVKQQQDIEKIKLKLNI